MTKQKHLEDIKKRCFFLLIVKALDKATIPDDTIKEATMKYRSALRRQAVDPIAKSMKEEARTHVTGNTAVIYGIYPKMTQEEMNEFRADNEIYLRHLHDDKEHWRTSRLSIRPCSIGTVVVHRLVQSVCL